MQFFGSGLESTLQTIGLLGVYLILFAESGLLIGFFLPGDSLLLTAGLLAATGTFGLGELVTGGVIAAVLGNQAGYHFGQRFGPRIFNKQDSLLFHKDHILRAETFYQKYGPAALIISRFTPFIRTFVPILAGVGRMNYRLFFLYNVIGAVAWVGGVSLAGYYLGRIVPNIDRYILPIIGLIIVVSAIGPLLAYWRHRQSRPSPRVESPQDY